MYRVRQIVLAFALVFARTQTECFVDALRLPWVTQFREIQLNRHFLRLLQIIDDLMVIRSGLVEYTFGKLLLLVRIRTLGEEIFSSACETIFLFFIGEVIEVEIGRLVGAG